MTMICGNCGFDDAGPQGYCKLCGRSGQFVPASDFHLPTCLTCLGAGEYVACDGIKQTCECGEGGQR